MSYVEDLYHYEDWEVDDGIHDEVTTISIVNDFFEYTHLFYPKNTEVLPLQYWVEMPGVGCISDWDGGGTYEDCVEWIKENYLNAYKISPESA